MKAQLDGMAAARRGDAAAAKAAAEVIVALAAQPGRHPFAQQIIMIQAAEAQALAAQAAGDTAGALAKMEEATALEDSISTLSQPPYPILPAHELYGMMLLKLRRPADALRHFKETLRRTPGRPKAVCGTATAPEAIGTPPPAVERYTDVLALGKGAD